MQSSLLRQSTTVVILLCSVFFTITRASQVLNLRDQTCSDGGVCLSVDGNVCCSGGDSGTNGCMFSSGVCCGNGYWCYEGQFCSSTDPSANSDGDVSCCSDAACKNVVGLGLFLIDYSEQPFYSGSSGAAASTSATGSSSANGPVTSSGSSPAGSTQLTVSAKVTSATSKTASTTPASPSSSTSSASPAATKSSGAGTLGKVDIIGGLVLPLIIVPLAWL